MTPSKSGSRTEERGRGISGTGRPFRSPRTGGLLPFSIRRSPPRLQPAPSRRLCGGQIPVTCPVGRSVSRRRATTRSHPLADPLLPSGGPIRPASYGRLSCACGAIRFYSARQSAPPVALFAWAQPIRPAMFGSQCAALAIRSLPLARKGAIFEIGCAGCAGCAAAQPAGPDDSVVRRGPFKAPRNQPMEPGGA